ISQVLESYYEDGTEAFTELNLMTASDKNDEGLKDIIKSIYFTAVASPEPLEYLTSQFDQYENDSRMQGILNDYNDIIRHKLIALESSLDSLHKDYLAVHHEDLDDRHRRDAFDALTDMIRSVAFAREDNMQNRAISLPPYQLKDGRTSFFKKIADPDEKKELTETQNKVKKSYNDLLALHAYTYEEVKSELSPMNQMSN